MTQQAQHEELTEELLQRLLASATPEAYLAQTATDDRSLADYLLDLIDARNMTRADVVRASAVNSTFVYQVFNGERHVGPRRLELDRRGRERRRVRQRR